MGGGGSCHCSGCATCCKRFRSRSCQQQQQHVAYSQPRQQEAATPSQHADAISPRNGGAPIVALTAYQHGSVASDGGSSFEAAMAQALLGCEYAGQNGAVAAAGVGANCPTPKCFSAGESPRGVLTGG